MSESHMTPIFSIEKKIPNSLGRAGILKTPHGDIKTPAFATVGTKGTVKALTPREVRESGSQVVLANTYHLYLQPGEKIVRRALGLHKFMNWNGPIITDSGGFQVFSLGAAYGERISKISKAPIIIDEDIDGTVLKNSKKINKLAVIDEDGVTFKNPVNGDTHRFTPEKSMEIQHALGADIIFAFDECTSPHANVEYQKEAMERTHRWAERCIAFHKNRGDGKIKKFTKTLLRIPEETVQEQFLFGIVQGGRFEELRKISARAIAGMNFQGFGIGGSFEKEDIDKALAWINVILPEEKPRHLLGIGEPLDILSAIENGADLFDCVMPTRIARNGTLLTRFGKINIENAKFAHDLTPIEKDCGCYSCQNFTKCYLSHLFRTKEILACTLASIHNLYFINNLFKVAREHILGGTYSKFKEEFRRQYK